MENKMRQNNVTSAELQVITLGNPFEGCGKSEFNAHMNYNAGYTDMMLYNSRSGNAA